MLGNNHQLELSISTGNIVFLVCVHNRGDLCTADVCTADVHSTADVCTADVCAADVHSTADMCVQLMCTVQLMCVQLMCTVQLLHTCIPPQGCG